MRETRSIVIPTVVGLLAVMSGCGRTVTVNGQAVSPGPDGGDVGPASASDGPAPPPGVDPDRATGDGRPCTAAADCPAGFCADGVCCNLACTGPCVSCNQPGFLGECRPVPPGVADPHGSCRSDPPESCGENGTCNGRGGCAKYTPGTPCRVGSCAEGNQFVPAGQCDGGGTCVSGVPISCAPFTCAGGACRTSCAGPQDCAGGACTAGSCGPRGNGQICAAAGECASGICQDGVCCDAACEGACMTCSSPHALGRCVAAPAGTASPACADQGPASCGTTGRCDGVGGCERYPDGTICRAASCDGASNQETPAGVCQSGRCQVPPPRSCAPYQGCSDNRCRTGCGGDGQCTAGNACSNGDCGKRPNGALCSQAGDCASGICAAGRCCASACAESCRSCAVPGFEGTCTDVPAGSPDPAGRCRQDACSDGCDGRGGCRRQPAGSVCGAASCEGQGQRVIRVCAETGACESRSEACPASQPVCENGVCQAPTPPACTAATCPGPCRICVADTCVDAPAGTSCPGGRCRMGGCVATCTPETCTGNRAECQGDTCVGSCSNANCAGPCRACSEDQRRCENANQGGDCGDGRICQSGVCSLPACNPSNCPGPCRRCKGDKCENANGEPCGVLGTGTCRGGMCMGLLD